MDLKFTIDARDRQVWGDALICWNPEGEECMIDYLMGSPSLRPEIKECFSTWRQNGLAANDA